MKSYLTLFMLYKLGQPGTNLLPSILAAFQPILYCPARVSFKNKNLIMSPPYLKPYNGSPLLL